MGYADSNNPSSKFYKKHKEADEHNGHGPFGGSKVSKKRGDMARKLSTGFKNFESMRAKKTHEILKKQSQGE